MEMGRRIGRCQIDGRAKLRNGSLNVAHAKQPLSRVGVEVRGLQVCFVLTDLRTQTALSCSSVRIAQLSQYRGKCRMSAGEVGLQADGFTQRCRGLLQLALLL